MPTAAEFLDAPASSLTAAEFLDAPASSLTAAEFLDAPASSLTAAEFLDSPAPGSAGHFLDGPDRPPLPPGFNEPLPVNDGRLDTPVGRHRPMDEYHPSEADILENQATLASAGAIATRVGGMLAGGAMTGGASLPFQIGGAMLGAAATEYPAQKLDEVVNPEDKPSLGKAAINVAAAGAGPVMGRVAAPVLQKIAPLASAPVRQALGIAAVRGTEGATLATAQDTAQRLRTGEPITAGTMLNAGAQGAVFGALMGVPFEVIARSNTMQNLRNAAQNMGYRGSGAMDDMRAWYEARRAAARNVRPEPVPVERQVTAGVDPAPTPETPSPEPAPGTTTTEMNNTAALAAGHKVVSVELPVTEITVDNNLVPQFKENANPTTGEVQGQELQGQRYERPANAIVAWELRDGRKVIVTGRHRLALAKRLGEKTIPTTIVREADGFTRADALTLDAQFNIRDGNGSLDDYANYFKNTAISESDARAAGLLDRAQGKAGWLLGREASDDLTALYRAGKIEAREALAIARTAPSDAGAQQVGIKFALEGRPAAFIENVMRATQAEVGARETTIDMFGADDSAMQEMAARAERAGQFQRELRDQIQAVQGAAKRPEAARKLGVDVKDPEGVSKKVASLKAELERWENWPQEPDLMAKVKGEAAPVAEVAPREEGPPEGAGGVGSQESGGEEPALAPENPGTAMLNIVAEARKTQARFLAEQGLTIEQAALLAPEKQAALQAKYTQWLAAQPAETPAPKAAANPNELVAKADVFNLMGEAQVEQKSAIQLTKEARELAADRAAQDAAQGKMFEGGSQEAGKQPWQMTRWEYAEAAKTEKIPAGFELLDAIAKKANRSPYNPDTITEAGISLLKKQGLYAAGKLTVAGRNKLDDWRQMHRANDLAAGAAFDNHYEIVEQALREGKPVPQEVLANYPDLAPDKPRGTSAVGDPMMPPPPPGTPLGAHADGRMPVTMERIMPGMVDVPTVMDSLENVLRVLGGESPIRAGRFYQQARGIFKTFSEVIRLKEGDNIPTAAHEVAHAFSKKIFGSVQSKPLIAALRLWPHYKAAVTELRALGKALYGSTKPAAGYTAEGLSELTRLWLTTESAAAKAPAATAWLEKEVFTQQPALAEAMQAARAKIDLWRGQGAQGRAAAQMKDPPGRLATLRDTAKKILGREGMVEKFAPLEQLATGFRKITGRRLSPDKDPFLLASSFRQQAGATLETMVERGMVDLWGNVTGPGLREAFARIKPEQAQDFAHYLWARRAIERWGKGKNPGMALPDAEYLRTKLETPAFVDAAAKYYQWWDGVLEYLKQASPATNGPLVDNIRAGSHDYVPLARALDPELAKAGAVRAGGGGLYKMHGSGLPVKEIYLQSLLVAERLIGRAHRDLVLDSILNLSEHEGMGWFVEEVPVTKVMEQVNVEKIRKEMEAYGVDTDAIPADTLLKFASHLDAPAGTDPIVARKTANGTKWYQIPADVYELLNGVETPQRLGWAFELLFGAPNRMFKLGTTGLRASFSLVTNPARDLPTFMLQSLAGSNSRLGNPAQLLAQWIGSMRQVVVSLLSGKESPELQLFHQLGIGTSNFLGGDVQQARRAAKGLFHGKIFRKVVTPLETLRELLSFSETAPRLAEMSLLAREMGWKPGDTLTPEQAIVLRIAASRVTTDFRAAGSVGGEINRAIPFFNASIQGARGATRAFKTDQGIKQKRAAWLKVLLTGIMAITLPAIWNWWRNKDEEWYQQLPWRERLLYINVKMGAGTVMQIPLAPDWGSAFATMPTAALDSWHQRDPEAMQQSMAHIFNVLDPVDLPVLGKTAKEQWQNRVDFFNRPIVPRGELDLLPGAQRSAYNSWLAQKLGDVFPGQISPRRFDAAVREVFGGVGSDVVDAPTAFMRALGLKVDDRQSEAADLPVIGRLFRHGGTFTANNQALIDYWDDLNRYKAWSATNTKALNDGRAALMPMTAPEQMYALMLDAASDPLQIMLEVAARTPELNKRQKLYQEAAKLAKDMTALRPKPGAK